MTDGNRNALWTVLGLSASYLSVDFWLATQGGDVRLPSPIEIMLGSSAAAVYGLFIVVPVFASFLYVTQDLLGPRSQPRLARLPHPLGLSIDVGKRLDRRLLAVVTTVFMLLPAAAVVHLENKMLKGEVVVSRQKQEALTREGVFFDRKICMETNEAVNCTIASDWKSHLFRTDAVRPLLSGEFENAFRYDPNTCGDKKTGCKGLTFFPFLEPWLLVLIGIFLLVYWVKTCWLILRPESPKELAS